MGWAPNWVGIKGGCGAVDFNYLGCEASAASRYLLRGHRPRNLQRVVGSPRGRSNWFQVADGIAAPGTAVTVVARNPDHLDLLSWERTTRSTASGGCQWRLGSALVSCFQPYRGSRELPSRPLPETPITLQICPRWDRITKSASGGCNRRLAANWFVVSGGVAAGRTSITAVTRNPNHIDLFAIGSNHGIFSTWEMRAPAGQAGSSCGGSLLRTVQLRPWRVIRRTWTSLLSI